MIDILTEVSDMDYKKRKYLKSCLEMVTQVGSGVDRRNSEDTLEYIDSLEVAVMQLNLKLKKVGA